MKSRVYAAMIACGLLLPASSAPCQEVDATSQANSSVAAEPTELQSRLKKLDELSAIPQIDVVIEVEFNCIAHYYEAVGEVLPLITDDDLKEVTALGDWVATVRLHDTYITDEGIRHLRPLHNLENLVISRERRWVERGFWDFEVIEVSDIALETICCLESLKWLRLVGSSRITDEGLSNYANSASRLKKHNGHVICQLLHHLELSELDIDGSCLEALALLPIESLELTRLKNFKLEHLSI